MSAAGLLYTSSPTPLLYESNHNLTFGLANIGDGDTISPEHDARTSPLGS